MRYLGNNTELRITLQKSVLGPFWGPADGQTRHLK